MRLSRRMLATLAAAALVVGGCGGDGAGGGLYGGGGGGGQASPTAEEETGQDEGTAGEADQGAATGEDSATEEDTSEDTAGGAETVLTIVDFSYDVPDSVEPGAQITVRNDDSVGHTVTADDGESFDVPVGPGEEVTLTVPEEEGEYPFHCIPHPDMTATLTVGG